MRLARVSFSRINNTKKLCATAADGSVLRPSSPMHYVTLSHALFKVGYSGLAKLCFAEH